MPIHPATRLSEVKEYYFSRKLKEVAQLRRDGKDIINLGIGSPDLMPHEDVVNSLITTAKGADNHGYQSYNGIQELREGFSKFYRDTYNTEFNPDTEVLPLMGSKEGVLHITLAFANPGDVVLCPNPGYAAYRSIANLVGVTPVSYGLTEVNGWQPDINEIREIVEKGGVKVLWLNYPHMPTGAQGDYEKLREVIEYCQTCDVLVVNDNPYSLVLPRGEPFSVTKLEGGGMRSGVVELNSLSKSHNMPGWRVGCVVGPAHLIKPILQVKSNFDSGMFKGLQTAASTALTTLPPSFHANLTAEYTSRRLVVYEILSTLRCSYSTTQVGLFVWARCPPHWEDVEGHIDAILHRASVFITPGSIFGSNGNRYIRISLCSPEPRLKEALARIVKHLENDPTAKL